MADNVEKKENSPKTQDNPSLTKPDPETLHTTDPQEEMKGPISSIVQAAKEKAEENDDDKK